MGAKFDGNNKVTGYDYTITCDEDATFYYVDEDGNITESSYNGVVIDNNDIAYAVIEDYMIQMLVIQEVKAPTSTYGVDFSIDNTDSDGYGFGEFTVDGKTIDASDVLEVADKGDDLYFTIKPVDGYQIDSVSGTGVVDLGNGNYVVRNVKSLVTVTVDVDKIPDATMSVQVSYVLASGDVVAENPPKDLPADTGMGYITVKAEAPKDYKLVGLTTRYVNFVEGGIAQVTFTVERETAELSLPTGVTATWDADASNHIEAGKAEADTETMVPVGAKVVLTGITGGYGKNGKALIDDEFTMTAEGKTVSEDDFGYVSVDVKGDPADITESGMAGVGYTVTASMDTKYVKMDTPTNVTVTISVTNKDGHSLQSARNVSVTTTGCSATNGTDLIAVAMYNKDETKTYDLHVSVNVDDFYPVRQSDS